MEKFRILIIDDTTKNSRELMSILGDEYHVYIIEYDKYIIENIYTMGIDMILIGVKMPHIDGCELCRLIKNHNEISRIPVILFGTRNRKIDIVRGIEIGAVDYLQEPYNPEIVKVRVNAYLSLYNQNKRLENMVMKRTREIEKTRLHIIRNLSVAAEFKYSETKNHIVRMSKYCYAIAKSYGLEEAEAQLLLNAAPMHDIGKIGIPNKILQKTSPLNDKESKIMRKHCRIGADIIGEHKSGLLAAARAVALEHHEKFNGTGYPNNLKGNQISIYGRIVALADAFDTLTSVQQHKSACENARVINHINEKSDKDFDPDVVMAFNRVVPEIISIKQRYDDIDLLIAATK